MRRKSKKQILSENLQFKSNYIDKVTKLFRETGQKPTYPLSAFCLFSQLRRKQIKEAEPQLKRREAIEKIKEEWENFPAKRRFKLQAKKDYQCYRRLLAEWEDFRKEGNSGNCLENSTTSPNGDLLEQPKGAEPLNKLPRPQGSSRSKTSDDQPSNINEKPSLKPREEPRKGIIIICNDSKPQASEAQRAARSQSKLTAPSQVVTRGWAAASKAAENWKYLKEKSKYLKILPNMRDSSQSIWTSTDEAALQKVALKPESQADRESRKNGSDSHQSESSKGLLILGRRKGKESRDLWNYMNEPLSLHHASHALTSTGVKEGGQESGSDQVVLSNQTYRTTSQRVTRSKRMKKAGNSE